jgi:transcriptional regulator with XRE-family HTH domain
MESEKYLSNLISFGKRLKELRKAKKLTLLDLEVMTGIGNGALSRIENGKKNIEFVTIVKLADALEVELIELFRFKEKVKAPKKPIRKNERKAKAP